MFRQIHGEIFDFNNIFTIGRNLWMFYIISNPIWARNKSKYNFPRVLSIVLFCVETLPSLSDEECKNGKPNYVEPFFILETICTIWFSWEVILRLISCPNRITYFKDFKNIVDIAAIVPYYVQLGNMLSRQEMDAILLSIGIAYGVCRIVIKSVQQCTYFLFSVNLLLVGVNYGVNIAR
jgi:hypothetical protein